MSVREGFREKVRKLFPMIGPVVTNQPSQPRDVVSTEDEKQSEIDHLKREIDELHLKHIKDIETIQNQNRESHTRCLKDLNSRLAHRSMKPGDLQWKWRTETDLKYDYQDVCDALLDALVNMGGATAWNGDGTSCAAQIVQNIIVERDYYKTKFKEAKGE